MEYILKNFDFSLTFIKNRLFFNFFLAVMCRTIIFALPKNGYAALVKGLRRIPFTDESRVRFPYAVLKGDFQRNFEGPLFLFPYLFERLGIQ